MYITCFYGENSYKRADSQDMGPSQRLLSACLVAHMVRNLPAMQETQLRSLGQEDPLEKGMATHSSNLAWKIPWTEQPHGLQSKGSQRVGHDWACPQRGTHKEVQQLRVWWGSLQGKKEESQPSLHFPRVFQHRSGRGELWCKIKLYIHLMF